MKNKNEILIKINRNSNVYREIFEIYNNYINKNIKIDIMEKLTPIILESDTIFDVREKILNILMVMYKNKDIDIFKLKEILNLIYDDNNEFLLNTIVITNLNYKILPINEFINLIQDLKIIDSYLIRRFIYTIISDPKFNINVYLYKLIILNRLLKIYNITLSITEISKLNNKIKRIYNLLYNKNYLSELEIESLSKNYNMYASNILNKVCLEYIDTIPQEWINELNIIFEEHNLN